MRFSPDFSIVETRIGCDFRMRIQKHVSVYISIIFFFPVRNQTNTNYCALIFVLLLDIKYPMRRRLRYQFVRKGQGETL